MFIRITRINRLGEEKDTILNVDYIVSITERHVEPTTLYDEDGNVVETRDNPKKFEIVLKDGVRFFTNEDTFDKLTKTLVK